MDCPNLDLRNPYDPVCRLQDLIYAPDDDEMIKICTTGRHFQCPLYLGNLCELGTRWIKWDQLISLVPHGMELEEILFQGRGEVRDDKDD